MSNIYIAPITSAGGRDWLLYERGQYHRPLCILSDHEVDRLIRDVAKAREQDAAKARESARRTLADH